jgi:hypothetical protein
MHGHARAVCGGLRRAFNSVRLTQGDRVARVKKKMRAIGIKP